MVAISQLWYNGSYTIAAKPIKTLESHYTMIQFLIKSVIVYLTIIPRARVGYEVIDSQRGA